MAQAAEVANPTLRYLKDGAIGWITADNPRANERAHGLHVGRHTRRGRASRGRSRRPGRRFARRGRQGLFQQGRISEFENSRTGMPRRPTNSLNDNAFNALIGCPSRRLP